MGDTPMARRDRAILRLLRNRALCRGDLVALHLARYTPGEAGGSISIMGKGRREPEELAIGRGTARALDDRIATRGDGPGPLFVGVNPGAEHSRPRRLTGEGVRRIAAAIAKAAAIDRALRPHSLRHDGVTAALDAGHPIRDDRKYSRHAVLDTLTIYDYRRRDVGGEIAQGLGEL